jgi:hypothetical protein
MNFDLNIENYTTSELAEMFELPANYDKNIIEIKETQLKDSIINNKEITKETQSNTLTFLIKAKNILINGQQQPPTKLQEKITDFYNSSYELKSSKLEDTNEHMVQVRSEKPYLTSFPSEYFPGIINPLKKRTIRKNLNIDTRFRDNYYGSPSTNFNIVLPINMNNVLSMQLSAIEIPTTYYIVSKQYNNNFFNVTLTATNDTKLITVAEGNYTIDGITNAINSALTLLGGNFANILFSANISSANGSGQMMVGIDSSYVGPTFDFDLNFQADKSGIDDRNTPLPLKLGWMLGFRNGIYTNNQNYVSEGIIDMSGPRYMYLVIDDHNNNVNNSFYSAFNSSLLNKNILARLSIQSDSFSIFSENNLNLITTPREYFGPVNLQNLNIQLLDEYGRTVDLNNMDYSFCLTLATVYDL